MRDLRGDRTGRATVREERLRATAGLRDLAALTSWRGRSGRRYVVGIHGIAAPDLAETDDLPEMDGAVMIAVRRADDGTAAMIDLSAPGASASRRVRQGWLAAMRARGATELHIHRLARSEAERRAVVADLMVTDLVVTGLAA